MYCTPAQSAATAIKVKHSIWHRTHIQKRLFLRHAQSKATPNIHAVTAVIPIKTAIQPKQVITSSVTMQKLQHAPKRVGMLTAPVQDAAIQHMSKKPHSDIIL